MGFMLNRLNTIVMTPTIVFKKGRTGEMTIDAIKGIAMRRMDGKTILLFPKYSNCKLLEEGRIKDWKEPDQVQIDALLGPDRSKEITDGLLEIDSPAAKFVRSVGAEFNIPNLLSTGTIWNARKEIDALANMIDGAETLGEYPHLMSCLRCKRNFIWYASGRFGALLHNLMWKDYVVVPCRNL